MFRRARWRRFLPRSWAQVPEFNWRQVPNVFARYDFTNSANLDLSGSNIITAFDLAGSNDLTQVTSTKRPVTQTVGGIQFAQFDGVDDHLLVTFAGGAQAFPHSVYLVLRFDEPADNLAHTVMDSVGGGNDNRLFVRKTTTNQRRVQGGATENLTFGSPPEATGDVEIWTLIHNGGPLLSCGFINGVKTVGDMGVNSLDSLTVGIFRDATSNPFKGLIGEIELINGLVSTYDHNRIGRHLARKYKRTWAFDVVPTTIGT